MNNYNSSGGNTFTQVCCRPVQKASSIKAAKSKNCSMPWYYHLFFGHGRFIMALLLGCLFLMQFGLWLDIQEGYGYGYGYKEDAELSSLSLSSSSSSFSSLTTPATKTTGTWKRRIQQFVNCSVVVSYQEPPRSILPFFSPKPPQRKPCALLFFGLAKQFRNLVLPSIQKYILDVQYLNTTNTNTKMKCDVFAHNYNITTIENPRVHESSSHLDPMEIYDLTSNVVMDTEEDFNKARNMRFYAHPDRKPSRKMGWDKTAFINMYKQWHSIERVWDLMEETERAQNFIYDRVGLFRSDVQYVTPINIFKNVGNHDNNNNNNNAANAEAVIPKFGFLVNDRMFYGTRDNAHIWAKMRYKTVDDKCYVPRHWIIGLHSEYFMNDLILKNIPSNITKDDTICFYRVRANGNVGEDDCIRKYDFPPILEELNLTYN